MLPKEYRLKKRAAFTMTYRTGKSFHKNGITVFCGKKKVRDTIPTKFGFVVSKKIHKRAVKRNRIKRLMRESMRLYLKSNPNCAIDYMSIVFVATSKLLNKDFSDINCSINKIMSVIINA